MNIYEKSMTMIINKEGYGTSGHGERERKGNVYTGKDTNIGNSLR